MNATKKQVRQPRATKPAAEVPVNPAPGASAAEPGVTVAGTVETRPDDAHPGEVIAPPADAQLEAAALALAAEAPAATAGYAFVANELGGTPVTGILYPIETSDAAQATDAPEANARALRRVEHDGKIYGPGEDAGVHLNLNADQLVDLQTIGAVEPL